MMIAGSKGEREATFQTRTRAWLRRRRDLALVLVAVLLACGLAEVIVRIGGWDLEVLYKMRYTVEGDFGYLDGVEIYRPSADSELIYETIPGARTTCVKCAHPAEGKYESFPITINSLGFRGFEVDPRADDGLFHVVVLGGSNTFGPSVADEDTYPARMQATLDRIAPDRFMVLNAGLNAYVMSQKVRYLEILADRFPIDLVIIQDYNQGRRAFFYMDPDYAEHFRRNPDLYQENLPWLFGMGGGLHRLLVRNSSFCRLVWGVLLRSLYVRSIEDCSSDESPFACSRVSETLDQLFYREAEMISSRRFTEVMEKVDSPVVVLLPLELDCDDSSKLFDEERRWGRHENVRYLRLCLPTVLPEEELAVWTHAHPPSHVYAWYGEAIVEALLLSEIPVDGRDAQGVAGSMTDTAR